jgi:hypothetical protein
MSGEAGDLTWGWGIDENDYNPCHVLYVDLPTGQVSFHAIERGPGPGPDYPGEWDSKYESADRIIRFCDMVICEEAMTIG